MAAAPEVAVAFTIREKFSCALASLRRLYAFAGAPFRLYFVDGRYPAPVREDLERFLADQDNVVRIAAQRFLFPNEALNAVVARASEPLLFLLQNDVLIGRNALQRLVTFLKGASADAVSPRMLDVLHGEPAGHHDQDLPAFTEQGGKIHAPRERSPRLEDGRRRIDFFELHCLLAKTAVLRELTPLPPLNVHEHVDLSLALWRRKAKCYCDEATAVLHVGAPPTPLRDFEVPYFSFRWDLGRARLSDRWIRKKWPLAELYEPTHFIGYMRQALQPEAVLARYETAFLPDVWPESLGAG